MSLARVWGNCEVVSRIECHVFGLRVLFLLLCSFSPFLCSLFLCGRIKTAFEPCCSPTLLLFSLVSLGFSTVLNQHEHVCALTLITDVFPEAGILSPSPLWFSWTSAAHLYLFTTLFLWHIGQQAVIFHGDVNLIRQCFKKNKVNSGNFGLLSTLKLS